MKLRLEAVEVSDEIGRCGTFAAAADQLDKLPSVLSYVVQKLESDFGVSATAAYEGAESFSFAAYN